jgi:hypothetical protein
VAAKICNPSSTAVPRVCNALYDLSTYNRVFALIGYDLVSAPSGYDIPVGDTLDISFSLPFSKDFFDATPIAPLNGNIKIDSRTQVPLGYKDITIKGIKFQNGGPRIATSIKLSPEVPAAGENFNVALEIENQGTENSNVLITGFTREYVTCTTLFPVVGTIVVATPGNTASVPLAENCIGSPPAGFPQQGPVFGAAVSPAGDETISVRAEASLTTEAPWFCAVIPNIININIGDTHQSEIRCGAGTGSSNWTPGVEIPCPDLEKTFSLSSNYTGACQLNGTGLLTGISEGQCIVNATLGPKNCQAEFAYIGNPPIIIQTTDLSVGPLDYLPNDGSTGFVANVTASPYIGVTSDAERTLTVDNVVITITDQSTGTVIYNQPYIVNKNFHFPPNSQYSDSGDLLVTSNEIKWTGDFPSVVENFKVEVKYFSGVNQLLTDNGAYPPFRSYDKYSNYNCKLSDTGSPGENCSCTKAIVPPSTAKFTCTTVGLPSATAVISFVDLDLTSIYPNYVGSMLKKNGLPVSAIASAISGEVPPKILQFFTDPSDKTFEITMSSTAPITTPTNFIVNAYIEDAAGNPYTGNLDIKITGPLGEQTSTIAVSNGIVNDVQTDEFGLVQGQTYTATITAGTFTNTLTVNA